MTMSATSAQWKATNHGADCLFTVMRSLFTALTLFLTVLGAIFIGALTTPSNPRNNKLTTLGPGFGFLSQFTHIPAFTFAMTSVIPAMLRGATVRRP